MSATTAHAKVPASAPRISAKKPSWYIAYCALALFNVVVLALSLWLNQREVRALDLSTNSFHNYANVLDSMNALGRSMFELNGAGNALFLGGEALPEDRRIDTALSDYRVELGKLHALIGSLSADARHTVAVDLDGIEAELAATYDAALAMRSALQAGEKETAARHMSGMNSRFGKVVAHMYSAARIIREEQFAVVKKQRRQASLARGFAAALAIVAILLAFAAVFHGRRLYRNARMEALKREQQMRHLSRARDQAEQAARAKARFLATMSHEIRTPMNGVLGMLDALTATSLSQSQATILKTAHSSADLLLSMIDDVLDFSLIDAHMLSIKNAPVDLCELAQRTLALYAMPAREKMLTLRLDVPDLPVDVLTDATRLSQVLCNFLGNALKFTTSGSVLLSLQAVEQSDTSTRVKFVVKDTGIGINSELQNKLFAPFTLGDSGTNRRYGGTGLGLAICRQLSKLLDPEFGEVGVESSPGAGAAFHVALTLKKTAVHAAGVAPADLIAARAFPKFSGRVLIAEDNETNRQVVQTMLRSLGLQNAIAADGNEAIAAVRRERFDLILMDYHMPELDGCGATEGIRRYEQANSLPRTPIVAVTASVLAEDREKCLASGMDDFVAKPLRQKTLAAVLEKWLPAESRAESSANSDAASSATWMTLPPEIFDSEQLLEMRALAGESFDDLIGQFHGSALDGLAAMRNAIESGDAVGLKRASHKLKGAASTLGAKTVAERCHALEVIGKEQRMEAAAEQLHCLEQEYLEVRRYMEACARIKAAPAA